MSQTLSQFFQQALQGVYQSSNLSTADDKTQSLVKKSLSSLNTIVSHVESLSLFSENEELRDLSTGNLRFLLLDYARGEMEGRVRTGDMTERTARLNTSKERYEKFLSVLKAYKVTSGEGAVPLAESSSARLRQDPAKRREAKIAQFKREKEMRLKLDNLKSALAPDASLEDFYSPLFPSRKASDEAGEDEEDDEESPLRSYMIALLQFLATQAASQIGSIDMELDLLSRAPPEPPRDSQADARAREREEASRGDASWRLDNVQPGGPDGRGSLMDSSGRPLRPFVILPSTQAAERQRLQAEVFRAGHRLPTMTIDQYLEEEAARGNIISGGGAASYEAPTSKETLQLATEQDGTLAAEEAQEKQRQESEEWARFTEEVRKGSGNTMNRG